MKQTTPLRLRKQIVRMPQGENCFVQSDEFIWIWPLQKYVFSPVRIDPRPKNTIRYALRKLKVFFCGEGKISLLCPQLLENQANNNW